MSFAPTGTDILALARARPATLGPGRLICIDGPAGSGKTTLAGSLGQPTVHMDDVYEGWTGLEAGRATVEHQVVGPLRRGEPGRYRRYDWVAGAYAEWVEVPVTDFLVIEGCGSGALAYADEITVLVWVEAPEQERMRRGLERDGDGMRDHWLRWQVDEAAMFERERTKDRADVVVRT